MEARAALELATRLREAKTEEERKAIFRERLETLGKQAKSVLESEEASPSIKISIESIWKHGYKEFLLNKNLES